MEKVLTISKRITNGKELVVLRREEYERLIRHGEEINHALRVISEGEKAYREGKTIKASSLKEAVRIYGKKAHH